MFITALLLKLCVCFINFQPSKNFEISKVTDCITTLVLVQKHPLLATNCCLTKLCPFRNNSELQHMMQNSGLLEFFSKLCSEKFYLLKEQSDGCIFENNLNNDAIANCSANFRTLTIKDETALINSGNTGEKRSGKYVFKLEVFVVYNC